MSTRWIVSCLLLGVFLGTTSCVRKSSPYATPSPGTAGMVALLKNIRDNEGTHRAAVYNNIQRAEELLAASKKAESLPDKVNLKFRAAREFIYGGNSDAAVAELQGLLDAPESTSFPGSVRRQLLQGLAIASLRQGEQDNCFLHHNSESCLFPIGGQGIHRQRRGSESAIRSLETLLSQQDDLPNRWLLNLAYMTVGKYPRDVPKQWRVPPQSLKSEYDMGRFKDIAPRVGLGVLSNAGGCVIDDFDGDGNFDIITSSSALDGQLRYFHNDGDGIFSDRTAAAGLTGLVGGLNILQGDYDNDGFPDLLVLRGGWMREYGQHPLSLLHNNGNGTFTDVTVAAGLLRFHPTQTAAFADYDNDGYLDIVVGNESGPWGAHPLELFHNNGNGTFTEVAAASGLEVTGFIKGVTWGDYDNDGRPDLFISSIDGSNHLFHNDGRKASGAWSFHDVTEQAGVHVPYSTFTTWFWDYDNDGLPDIFVSGYFSSARSILGEYFGPVDSENGRAHLFRNLGNGKFSDVSQAVGLNKHLLSMGGNFGDLDNDGYPDIYLGTGGPEPEQLVPNRMFRNDRGLRFQDVTTSAGVGHLQKGHGICFADLDNDGDLDVFETMGGVYQGDTAHNVLYENPGNNNHWISLKLEGVTSNRAGLGARIAVFVEGGTAGTKAYRARVSSGGSFGASPMEQHIGLGKAARIESIQIWWPGSTVPETIKGPVPLDSAYRLRQATGKLEKIMRKKIRWHR